MTLSAQRTLPRAKPTNSRAIAALNSSLHRQKLTAKEVELHAWAAGVIPEKISGTQIVVTKSAIAEAYAKVSTDATRKIRRGTAIKLILKSENMTIAREAAVLMDAFPGETVDVRLAGTRKNLRARLVDAQTAEVTP